MDDFNVDLSELSGALMTLEFGSAGRIMQLWASDPSLPGESEEFQFVLPNVNFGEELAEDYYPGTILVGARTSPDEPWIVSRSSYASPIEDDSDIHFEYELELLPDLRLTGKYYEVIDPIPQIVWDIRIANRGKASIEIGELALPFALNNLYEGFGRNLRTNQELWQDRVVIHKSIGGTASYLFAQRLTGEPPGLLIFPGEDTQWEFFTHAQSSLSADFRWEGIPIVYIHSRASVEREGWDEWANGHTSIVLEPGDSRSYQTRFVPADRDQHDNLAQTLSTLGKPAIRLLTAAVAPVEVGVALEVSGVTPTRFFADKPVHTETDADEEGGFCFVKPFEPGPLRLSFEDNQGGTSHTHLWFTEPIEALIKKRADWILANQLYLNPGKAMDGAFLVANTRTKSLINPEDDFVEAAAIEGGLSDAVFLAEKNTIFPDTEQIHALDRFIDNYLMDDLQNPGDYTVGSAFADSNSVALNYSRPHVYPIVFNLYHSMFRVASLFGETRREGKEYLNMAFRTALAMLRHGIPRQGKQSGFPGFSQVFSLLADLANEGLSPQADFLLSYLSTRSEDLLKRGLPSLTSLPDPSLYSEVFTASRYMGDETNQDKAIRYAYVHRSLSPSWWWYGSDTRQWDSREDGGLPIPFDNGELCMGYTGPENSMMFFNMLDRDYGHLPEAHMRQAFGGMLGIWALVASDGSASMGYCPDRASRMFGFSPLTGDIGLGLFHYLRAAGSYVLPSRTHGVFTFGCHFEATDSVYKVRPWDGVGRRVVIRQIGAEFSLSIGRIRELELDLRKRWARLLVENPSDKDLQTELRIRGLWGKRFRVMGKEVDSEDGELAVSLPLLAHGIGRIEIEVAK